MLPGDCCALPTALSMDQARGRFSSSGAIAPLSMGELDDIVVLWGPRELPERDRDPDAADVADALHRTVEITREVGVGFHARLEQVVMDEDVEDGELRRALPAAPLVGEGVAQRAAACGGLRRALADLEGGAVHRWRAERGVVGRQVHELLQPAVAAAQRTARGSN